MPLIARLSTYITLFLALTLPLSAQDREGVMGDLIRDVTGVETKIVGLAKAMPASAYEWRPAASRILCRLHMKDGELGALRLARDPLAIASKGSRQANLCGVRPN